MTTAPSTRFSIAIPTAKRPDLLRRCLESIRDRATWPDSFELDEVIVIDNDPRRSAAAVVDSLHLGPRLPIRYSAEREPGVAAVRNRAVREAIDRDVDYLVMIDDDEHVVHDWPGALLAHQ